MVRAFLAGLLGLAMTLNATALDDHTKHKGDTGKKGGKGREATITKVDPKAGTLQVKVTDKNGKETERTFTLTEEVRYADSTGKVVAADVFKSGDYVLVVEAEGKMKEARQTKTGGTSGGKGDKDKGM